MKFRLSLALIILACTLAMSVAAQDNQWSLVKGDNIIEASSAGIHVKQRDAKDTNAFALARKNLNLGDKPAWRVAFDVRYGELQPVGSTVKLGIGDTLIGAVGADKTGLKVYLGNDKVKYLQATDAESHHFEFVCDGITTSVWHNGSKVIEEPTQGKPNTLIVGAWSEGKWLSRQTELWMQNLETSKPDLPSLTTPATDAQTIPIPSADKNIFCQVGDHLQLTGTVTMQDPLDTCLFLVDGTVAATRNTTVPTDHYSFTWTPQTPGTHTLEFRYTNYHAKVTVRRLLVTATDSPPAVFAGLPATSGTDTSVTVVGAGPNPFPLARVDFYFNDKPLAVATAAPFATTLPIEAFTKPGTYPVKFIAYDASGRSYYARPAQIEVPQRVQVMAPRTLTLRSVADKASLTASILPGIKVAKISYSIVHANVLDYQTIAEVSSAPYSTNVDLSSRASGDYWVKAIVTSEAGNSYEAWAVPLTLTNMPDDARKVQEAKERAAREEKKAADAADAAKKQLEAELTAKREEDNYEQQVADNTVNAITTNRISIELDGNLTKFEDSYLFTLKITNRTNKGVGPINPDLRFDDFSFSISLPIDTSLTPSINQYGFPTKYLTDMWHDLVVPANSTKTISYFDYNFSVSEKSRKPTKITFMGTLRPIIIPLTP